MLDATAVRVAGTRVEAPARLLAAWVAPMPWELPEMELRIGTWFGTFPIRDESGRQLGEANTVPVHLRDGAVAHHWRPSRIAGCREGRPFSVAALRQVTGEWRGVLSDVGHLRECVVRRLGLGASATLAPLPLLVLARTVTSLPAYLHRRRRAPISDGTLPARFAAAFKVMAGVHMAVEDLLLRDHDGTRHWSAEELLSYIERRELFVSPEGNACGGPVKMILELLHLCIDGPKASLPHSAVPDHVRALGRFLDYGETCARLELMQLRHRAALALALAPIEDAPSHPLATARQLDELSAPQGARALPRALRAMGVTDVFDPEEERELPRWLELATRQPVVRQTYRRLAANQRQARAAYQPLSDQIQDALGEPCLPVSGDQLFARARHLRRAVQRAGVG